MFNSLITQCPHCEGLGSGAHDVNDDKFHVVKCAHCHKYYKFKYFVEKLLEDDKTKEIRWEKP